MSMYRIHAVYIYVDVQMESIWFVFDVTHRPYEAGRPRTGVNFNKEIN